MLGPSHLEEELLDVVYSQVESMLGVGELVQVLFGLIVEEVQLGEVAAAEGD